MDPMTLSGDGRSLPNETAAFALQYAATPYSGRGQTAQGSAIDASLSLLAADPRPIISFAMGSPAPDAIPWAEIAAAAARVLAPSAGSAALDYAPTEGLPALRAALLRRLHVAGTPIDPACLLVTAGGMQGLDLVYRLFLEPGDLVITESPSYANGLATAHNHGAELLQIPVDGEGLDIAAAEAAVARAGRPPRVIYAIPTFQNPSGTTYSLERRRRLLDVARSWGSIVIEDDPYSELRYEGEDVPSLLSLDRHHGTVIQVRTFSKIVAPGLRLGWLVGPADVIRRMVDLRQSMDTCANALSQQIVADLLTSGAVDRHVARLRDLYPSRRDWMIAALRREVGDLPGVRWTRPEGGMFLWLDLPGGLDGQRILAGGLERGVAIVPGAAFDPERCREAVRLCFSAVDETDIDVGIARLGATIRAALDDRGIRADGGGPSR
jgi:2-aminoadipate transaminase